MSSQFSFFSQQMAELRNEFERNCRALAGQMARVNAFGHFCETFHLRHVLHFGDGGQITLRAVGEDLQAAERDALLADIRRHDYEVSDAREEQDVGVRLDAAKFSHLAGRLTSAKFSHLVSRGGYSFELVYWMPMPAPVEGL